MVKILTLGLAILLLVSLIATSTATSNWSTQIIDNDITAWSSGYCPIVVDSNDMPHIAYTTRFNQTFWVMYARWNGSGWSSQTIVQGITFCLKIDNGGNPHILFGVPLGPLKYASWTGYLWSIETVAAYGGYGDLAFDSAGNPHVAFIDGATINYATGASGSWSIQSVDTNPEGGLSLSLDQNNTPYILYYSENLKLAKLPYLTWIIENITTVAGFGNVVLDSNGYPHLIYKVRDVTDTGISNTLVYAKWNGSVWINQTVVSNTNFDVGSLALDKNGNPCITYLTSSNELIYARLVGTQWASETINTTITPRAPAYLALDSKDNPHISYQGRTPGTSEVRIMYGTAQLETMPSPSPTQASTPVPTQNFLSPEQSLLLVATVVIVIVVFALFLLYRRHRTPV